MKNVIVIHINNMFVKFKYLVKNDVFKQRVFDTLF